VKEVVIHPLDDPKSALASRSVFFEFDSAQVAASSTQMLTEHAKYMRAHSSAKVRLEGNTDERGGREYNLALGQKRADAVGNAFKLLGVSTAQMEMISYGKEKPTSLAHDEAAWSKDRRVDIVYQSR
jgi:peptidoglycan-associated lipoprotein